MTSSIERLGAKLRALPEAANFVVGLLLLLAVWRVDRLTTAQVNMSIFYLLPIGYCAWFAGSRWAYAMALLSACAWITADYGLHPLSQDPVIFYWNACVRVAYFIIVSVMSSMIVKLRELYVFEKRAEEKAREASQLKSNMLSLVSHEFGNNLTTLKMVPFLLRDSEKGEIPIERQQLYSMLERVVTHLSGAVSNFLNLNRLESGKFTPAIRRIPIRVLIHEVILLLEPQIDGKNVALKIDFPTQPVPARADPDALALVMTNLIGNAFKYTPSGGEVTVRIATEGSPASDVLISIEDTGIGISQEDQKRLTSAFFRAEEGKSAAKGFGVGLKVARDLLESQGSQLRLESAPGKGSRFFFRLPLWPSEPHPTTPDMGAS